MRDILMGVLIYIVLTIIVSLANPVEEQPKPEQEQSDGSKQVSVEADIVLTDNAEMEEVVLSPQTSCR